MKSLAGIVCAIAVIAQVNSLAIRPAVIRPAVGGLTRPMIPQDEQIAARPCVVVDESELEEITEEEEQGNRPEIIAIKPAPIDQGTIIRPVPIQGGGAQILLPTNRPLKPSDLIKPAKPAQPEIEQPIVIKPAPIDQGTIIQPVPIQGGGGQVLLPTNRPLKPSDLIKPAKPEVERPSVKPAPIDQGTLIRPMPVEGGSQQVLLPIGRPLTPADLLKPANPEQEVEQEEDEYVEVDTGNGATILLPINRPLRPSDLLKPAQRPTVENEEAGPLTRPAPVNVGSLTKPALPVEVEADAGGQEGETIGTRPIFGGSGSSIETRPAVVRPETKPITLLPFNPGPQTKPGRFPPTPAEERPQIILLPNDRPLRPSDLLPGLEQEDDEEEEGQEQEQPQIVLLPNDRPLRPSDLLPPQQRPKPSVKPVPINQGNGHEQVIIVRPRPVVPVPIPELEESVEEERPQIVLLPNDRPLKPSDLLPPRPAVKPVPINQGNGHEQVIIVRPRPVVPKPEERPPVVLLPNDRPLRPSDLLPGLEQQQEEEEVEQQEDEQEPGRPQIVLLPNDRPLRPSDLLPPRPAVKPVPINQGNGHEQVIIVRPQPEPRPVVPEEQPQIVLLPNDRPLRPSDLLFPGGQADEEQAQEEQDRPQIVLLPNDRPLRPSDLLPPQQQNNRPSTKPGTPNWNKYPEGYLPIRPVRPNDIIF